MAYTSRMVMAAALLALVPAASARAQDAAAGERVFLQCRACHQVGPTARVGVGPPLNGLFGRKAGTYPNFNYSPAYRSLDKVWDEENFRVYIRNPREVTPGTRMVFNGLRDETQITNLIAYLRQFNAEGQRQQ